MVGDEANRWGSQPAQGRCGLCPGLGGGMGKQAGLHVPAGTERPFCLGRWQAVAWKPHRLVVKVLA